MPLAVLLISYHALRISAGESAEVIKQRVDKLLRDKLPLLKDAPVIDF